MTTYQCAKCGNTYEEPKVNKSPDMKDKVSGERQVQVAEKCCPTCAEMGELCKDDEEFKADRYD